MVIKVLIKLRRMDEQSGNLNKEMENNKKPKPKPKQNNQSHKKYSRRNQAV